VLGEAQRRAGFLEGLLQHPAASDQFDAAQIPAFGATGCDVQVSSPFPGPSHGAPYAARANKKAGTSRPVSETPRSNLSRPEAYSMNDLDRLAGMIAGLQAHGLSVSEIGRRIKVSRCHAYRLAAGDVRRPSHDTFSKLEKLQAQVVKIAKPASR